MLSSILSLVVLLNLWHRCAASASTQSCAASTECDIEEAGKVSSQAMLSLRSVEGISSVAVSDEEEEKCTTATAPVDLVFLVDGSGSVKQAGFDASKLFVKNVVNNLAVGAGAVDTRVAIMQFSTNVQQQEYISLPGGTSKSGVLAAVDQMIWHKGGSTHIGKGIDKTVSATFPHARKDAQKMLALIADGVSNDQVEASAAAARAQGIQIVAIAVGAADQAQMKNIAGSTGKFMYVTDYTKLSDLVGETTKIVCEKVDPPPTTTTIPPTTTVTEVKCVGDCPYCKPHGTDDNDVHNDMPLCKNGEFQWACVTGNRGGRVACPYIAPIMCAKKKCDGDQDYCCEKDCGQPGDELYEKYGGPRLCN